MSKSRENKELLKTVFPEETKGKQRCFAQNISTIIPTDNLLESLLYLDSKICPVLALGFTTAAILNNNKNEADRRYERIGDIPANCWPFLVFFFLKNNNISSK